MPLRPTRGNMYTFVSHTWNPIKGICPHDCKYCYMKGFPLKELRLVENELQVDLGKDRFIFVGSGCDVFAKDVPGEWIEAVLERCRQYPDNKYLFQSKNPARMLKALKHPAKVFPPRCIFGTTIETNRQYDQMGKAPLPIDRAEAMIEIRKRSPGTMVSIEPIMDFDLDELIKLVRWSASWVNIGADSKGNNLPEPDAKKIRGLIEGLKPHAEVKLKENLRRIYEQA